MINNFKREKCIACNTKLSEDLVYIGEQYPSAVFTKDKDYRSKIQASSLNLAKCLNDSCGLVQLAYEYNLDYVYENYPYLSGSTATMTRILADVVSEVEGLSNVEESDVVLDIGGNDGTLLNLFSKSVKYRVNIDAAHGIVSVLNDSNYVRIQEKFTSNVYIGLNLPLPKVIFSVAMFYQLNDPLSFCNQVKEIMNDDTIWCIQMTYLGSMLESNIYDNIVHEHVAYYSLKSLEYLMNRAGLTICGAKIVDSYGGSLRVYIMKKSGKYPDTDLFNNVQVIRNYEYENNINTSEILVRFNERINIIKEFTKELLYHIVDKDGKVHAFGASTKGNMICQFVGVNHKHIEYVLDNNFKKIGLIMTGTDIPIVDEKEFLPNLAKYILILPYYYTDHFKSVIERNVKKGDEKYLIIPLPKPHIIKLSGTL